MLSSISKLGIDISIKIIEKDNFVVWGEITIIICTALYLMGVLIIKHGKEANLWIIVGTLTLTAFMLGCFLRNRDIIILGIMILMSRWDKMKKKSGTVQN